MDRFELTAQAELPVIGSFDGCSDRLQRLIRERLRFGHESLRHWAVVARWVSRTVLVVETCREAGLIDTDLPWWRYLLSQAFFDDFYMTDVIKYRGTSVGAGDVDRSFTEFLIHELEYVEPDLVFAFGKRAWEALRDRLHATPVGEPPPSHSVVDVHGVLHETDRLVETAVLPLGHPSPNFRGAQLAHEAYLQGVADGLDQYHEEYS